MKTMQRQNRNFLIFETIGSDFATLAKKDKGVGAVPVLHNIKTFVDFSSELFRIQIVTEENSYRRLTKFHQCLIRRMLYVGAIKASDNRFRLGRFLNYFLEQGRTKRPKAFLSLQHKPGRFEGLLKIPLKRISDSVGIRRGVKMN